MQRKFTERFNMSQSFFALNGHGGKREFKRKEFSDFAPMFVLVGGGGQNLRVSR